MGWLLAAAILLPTLNARGADEPLPSRPTAAVIAVLPDQPPVNFDLVDFRQEERRPAHLKAEAPPHSFFVVKQHLGFAGGYDNGVVHGSVGFYMTVAEWGRWNFGVPAPEFGFGRYQVYDEKRKVSTMKTQSSIFISLASVHYRGTHIESLGMTWYVNLEQIFDWRTNLTGSQVGISFSTK